MSNPISPTVARWYDWLAGFRGQALDTAVAIEQAESSLVATASNTRGNSAGTDRGIWEINSAYHPEVSNLQAYDPLLASQQAFRIYQQSGNSFRQWSTYVSGAYQKFLGNVGNLAGFIPQWFQQNTSQGYGVNGETGNDIATPFHTPISTLYGGTVLDAGYHPYGGQVEIATNVPGYGNVTETIIHLDTIAPNIVAGARVSAGDLLGLSGGENPGYPGAQHPALPAYSSGPHTEIDFESNGKNIDPSAIVAAFRGNQQTIPAVPVSGAPEPVSGSPVNISTSSGGDPCAAYSLFTPEWFTCKAANIGGNVAGAINGDITSAEQALQSLLIRGGLVLGGSVLVIIGLLVMFFGNGGSVVKVMEGAASE